MIENWDFIIQRFEKRVDLSENSFVLWVECLQQQQKREAFHYWIASHYEYSSANPWIKSHEMMSVFLCLCDWFEQ